MFVLIHIYLFSVGIEHTAYSAKTRATTNRAVTLLMSVRVFGLILRNNPKAATIIKTEKYLKELSLERQRDPFIWWRQKKLPTLGTKEHSGSILAARSPRQSLTSHAIMVDTEGNGNEARTFCYWLKIIKKYLFSIFKVKIKYQSNLTLY